VLCSGFFGDCAQTIGLIPFVLLVISGRLFLLTRVVEVVTLLALVGVQPLHIPPQHIVHVLRLGYFDLLHKFFLFHLSHQFVLHLMFVFALQMLLFCLLLLLQVILHFLDFSPVVLFQRGIQPTIGQLRR
jgi:hypothetical protein